MPTYEQLLKSLERSEPKRAIDELQGYLNKRNFEDWLKTVSPTWTWDWAHLIEIRKYLSMITSGEIKKLMIFLHPRRVLKFLSDCHPVL